MMLPPKSGHGIRGVYHYGSFFFEDILHGKILNCYGSSISRLGQLKLDCILNKSIND